jgi:hypothetical protein
MKCVDNVEVIGNSKNEKIYFEDITEGEVFYYDGILYLRLANEVKKADTLMNNNEYNAIDLTDGSLASFMYDEEVGKFNKEPELIYNSNDIQYYKN